MTDSDDREYIAQRAAQRQRDDIRNAAEQRREAELVASQRAATPDVSVSPERAAYTERQKWPLWKLQREREAAASSKQESPVVSSSIPGLTAGVALEGADEKLNSTERFLEWEASRGMDWSGDLKNRY